MAKELNRVIVIPDSYKGTLSAVEVADTMKESILQFVPSAEVLTFPISDGGEGLVDSFLTFLSGEKIEVTVQNLYGEEMISHYGLFKNKEGNPFGVIEMAAAAGIFLAKGEKDPSKTTTYGVGELILHAVENGCKEIFIGLGGSGTNDFGTGAAAAAGAIFKDKNGVEFVPVGGTLSQIKSIDISSLEENLAGVQITALCDITNPLYGKEGAAYIFAPQKGANSAMVEFLDQELRAVSATVEQELGVSVAELSGAGAAGGMGGGMYAFFGATLQSGIETMLELIAFESLLSGTDIVFTGEGQIDGQSLGGKAISGIAEKTKAKNIPLIAVVGSIGKEDTAGLYQHGISAVFSINQRAEDLAVSAPYTKENLTRTMENIVRVLLLS